MPATTPPPNITNLNHLPQRTFVTLSKVNPAGALQARKGADGVVTLYWRYTHEGASERVNIGRWNSTRPPRSLDPLAGEFSIAAATRAAERLAQEHVDTEGGRPALLAARDAQNAASRKARQDAPTRTLRALTTAYCDHLEKLERTAHKDARSIFNLHLGGLADLQAAEVSDEMVADAMRVLMEAGKARTAGKLRSYLRAAYATAKRSRVDPAVPVGFKVFGISNNPVADVPASAGAAQPDKDPATLEELRRYWREIRKLEGTEGGSLQLHLASGGQRVAQLVRLKTADLGKDTLKLLDGKGRPGRPAREHILPVTAAMRASLKTLASRGEFAISTDGDGAVPLAASTIAAWSKEAAKRAGIKDWTIKRVRSGVETALAAAGVSKELRGHLQSHGITGVQARHYDAHDYVAEKKKVLETLMNLLESRSGTVVPMKRRKAA